MKKSLLHAAFGWMMGMLFYSNAIAQKNFTLEEIWSGKFRLNYLYNYETVNDDQLLISEFKHGTNEINLYDLPTGNKIKTLFSTASHNEFRYIEDFVHSADLRYFLLAAESKAIYRHSVKSRYYFYDTRTGDLKIFSKDYIQIPAFSPQGDKIVYFKDNNLYYKKTGSDEEFAITTDGEKNRIINGKTDWVYEEEFSFVKAYVFSKDGKYLAYLKFDETAVPEYTLLYYADKTYPETYTYKYPKAGEPNSKVSLHLYAFDTGKTVTVTLNDDEYIPYLQPGYRQDEFLVMTLNRRQNDLKLFAVNTAGEISLIGEQTSDKYVDFERVATIKWKDENHFFWLNEKDGYNHIYSVNRQTGKCKQITKGKWEVTKFYGYDEKTDRLFFQSTATGSLNRVINAIGTDGKNLLNLSPAQGYASADFSGNFRYFLLAYSTINMPPEYAVYRVPQGKEKQAVKLYTFKDNQRLLRILSDYQPVKKEFTSFRSAGGKYDLNAMIYYPVNFDSDKKYPVLIYQYNGPGYQTVLNRWGYYDDLYHRMLAQEGFMVVSVDTRGTGGRGARFRQLTYKQLGNLETEDLQAVARQLKQKPYTDKTGIWGWSYGGFTASRAILQAGDVFDAAIAVAPVTDWRFYDTVYTERYMQTPEENPEGYDETAALTYAELLHKPFLLVHGTADDNVHVQNTYELARRLQEEGKIFDMHIYPDKNHGIYGGKTRYQLYSMMHRFLLNHLKN